MYGIVLNAMPRRCDECPFLMKVENLCVYCMAGRFQVKYSETDLRDGICPIVEIEPIDESEDEDG